MTYQEQWLIGVDVEKDSREESILDYDNVYKLNFKHFCSCIFRNSKWFSSLYIYIYIYIYIYCHDYLIDRHLQRICKINKISYPWKPCVLKTVALERRHRGLSHSMSEDCVTLSYRFYLGQNLLLTMISYHPDLTTHGWVPKAGQKN